MLILKEIKFINVKSTILNFYSDFQTAYHSLPVNGRHPLAATRGHRTHPHPAGTSANDHPPAATRGSPAVTQPPHFMHTRTTSGSELTKIN